MPARLSGVKNFSALFAVGASSSTNRLTGTRNSQKPESRGRQVRLAPCLGIASSTESRCFNISGSYDAGYAQDNPSAHGCPATRIASWAAVSYRLDRQESTIPAAPASIGVGFNRVRRRAIHGTANQYWIAHQPEASTAAAADVYAGVSFDGGDDHPYGERRTTAVDAAKPCLSRAQSVVAFTQPPPSSRYSTPGLIRQATLRATALSAMLRTYAQFC